MNIVPNITQNNPEYLIINKNVQKKYFDFLKCEILFGTKINALKKPVDTHIDMQLVHLGKNDFVCEKTAYEYFKKILPQKFNLIKGWTSLKSNYPSDIAYNIARVGKNVICNYKHTDDVIKSYIAEHNLTVVDVMQGYAKCNVCVVDENTIITSDDGIYKKCALYGIDALKIQSGHIKLEGYDYGFIGGASVKINKNTLFFFGDVKKHPDYQKIKEFVNKKGIDILCINGKALEDIGSVVII